MMTYIFQENGHVTYIAPIKVKVNYKLLAPYENVGANMVEDGKLHKEETSDVVTIIETPPIMVVGIVAYINTPRGLLVWATSKLRREEEVHGDLDEVVEMGAGHVAVV
nr:60S ribosomal protein L3 [Tanacetum cinerariifolium]